MTTLSGSTFTKTHKLVLFDSFDGLNFDGLNAEPRPMEAYLLYLTAVAGFFTTGLFFIFATSTKKAQD
ncbi:hypothetical protein KO498_02160 [Lentibacter algarum]|uniref:hypothetical protein n=1 Tax=Lentibacter algarum TaxID=576131 RepID=UPI001C0734E0|nr:hypothetical protein [Lentibacter algarum]MBU2980608.1 hypothetical protein [Lentibacter algarum]